MGLQLGEMSRLPRLRKAGERRFRRLLRLGTGAMIGVRVVVAACLLATSVPAPSRAQFLGEDYAPAAGLSRNMQLAIRFYDQVRDS